MWQNNTCHKIWKNCIYTSKLRLWVEFLGEIFFMVYDIVIHELNLGPFKYLKFLDEISFKKCVFFSFLRNKCIIIIIFMEKTITILKRRRFDRRALHYFQFSFVWWCFMNHKHEALWSLKNYKYVYYMYINFIQFSSFNCCDALSSS